MSGCGVSISEKKTPENAHAIGAEAIVYGCDLLRLYPSIDHEKET
jgi:hypothetical protein